MDYINVYFGDKNPYQKIHRRFIDILLITTSVTFACTHTHTHTLSLWLPIAKLHCLEKQPVPAALTLFLTPNTAPSFEIIASPLSLSALERSSVQLHTLHQIRQNLEIAACHSTVAFHPLCPFAKKVGVARC